MRVAVTGAEGGIGRQVVAHLVSHGHEVVAGTRTDKDVAHAAVVVVGDCSDETVARSLLRDVDVVIHLAAVPAPVGPDADVFRNNVQATFRVLHVAAELGLRRAVVASSISVLGLAWGRSGRSPEYVPIDEEHPLEPEDPYGLSKQVGESVASAVARRHGLPVLSLRFPFTAGGERLRERVDEVAADPASAARELWAWLHVDDAAEAVRLALSAPTSGHVPLNVLAPDTLSDVPTEELLSTYHPGVTRRRPLVGTSTPYTTERAQAVLGFRARRTWWDGEDRRRSPSPARI